MADGFSVAVDGGELVGSDTGEGEPVVVLHGGPLTDYTQPLVELLPRGLRAIRYQQRGLPPSTDAEPFDVDTHVRDALAILDERGIERAWLLGHSWGGHLAFHLAVNRPERVIGVVAIDPLGAVPDGGWAALDAALFGALEHDSPEDARRAEEIDRRMQAGDGSADEANESLRLVWPYYFADPKAAPPMPDLALNVALYGAVFASVHDHFQRGTLQRGLLSFRGPFTVIHGERDPLPAGASRDTVALVDGAELELIRDSGHFPWLERPEQTAAALAAAFARPR